MSPYSEATDQGWMGHALALAEAAAGHGNVPVGAVLVDEAGQRVADGHNQRNSRHDPTAHAEIEAIRSAAEIRGTWRLDGLTMYVTLEPCVMCAGALVNARIRRLVYAAPNPDAGAIDSLFTIGRDPRLNHRFAVTAGVEAAAAAELLRTFFAVRRG
jgi:tRNA(adenine34) deaminase